VAAGLWAVLMAKTVPAAGAGPIVVVTLLVMAVVVAAAVVVVRRSKASAAKREQANRERVVVKGRGAQRVAEGAASGPAAAGSSVAGYRASGKPFCVMHSVTCVIQFMRQ